MHIALFGAENKPGQEIIAQALDIGHELTVLVHDSANINLEAEKLYFVLGNVCDANKVEETLACADAVIFLLGPCPNSEGGLTEGAEHIVSAMRKRQIGRLVAVSALGVGDSHAKLSRSSKMLQKTVHKKRLEEQEKQEAVIQNCDLDWIIVRPSNLTKGPLTERYQIGINLPPGSDHISRQDAAHFILHQLTDNSWLHQTPIITNY